MAGRHFVVISNCQVIESEETELRIVLSYGHQNLHHTTFLTYDPEGPCVENGMSVQNKLWRERALCIHWRLPEAWCGEVVWNLKTV